MSKPSQKSLVEEKEALDLKLKDLTGYYSPADLDIPADKEQTEVSTQYAELTKRQKELEEQIGEHHPKEKEK